MQSYCEVKTGKSINWYDRLNELKELRDKGGENYYSKKRQYLIDSSKWVTCACGNMCDIIPRDNRIVSSGGGPGLPLDGRLQSLGCKFPILISADKIDEAIDCLDKIEERSTFLIKEELKKQIENG